MIYECRYGIVNSLDEIFVPITISLYDSSSQISAITTGAVCAAVISSVKDVAIPHEWVFLAEVGILGQIAKVPLMERRLEEAQRLGFKTAFTAPLSKQEKQHLSGLTLQEITEINELALKLR